MTNNNYQPRPPMGDLFATIFWALVIFGILVYCVGELIKLFE